MSEKINIFKNLDDLKTTNLLDQLKFLEPVETFHQNDSEGLENDDFDFDTVVDKKSIGERILKRNVINEKAATSEKRTKKKTKPRRSSTSTIGSLSPTMPLLENLGKKVYEMPVGRQTRRSLRGCSQVKETSLDNYVSPIIQRGRGKGRGRGRARGRGRGNARLSVSSINEPSDISQNSSLRAVLQLSSNEVSEQEAETINRNSATLSVMERFLQQGNMGRSRVMRGRRRCIAEIAARSTQVDYIDLVSSPMHRVEGFIDLDSYTEEEEPRRTTRSKKKSHDKIIDKTNNSYNPTNTALDISLEEDNPELNIKVNWKGKPEAFKLRKHQKFSIIFEQLSKRENIGIENIVFNLNDRIIMADDTPDSINYKIFHFIDGRVLTNRLISPAVCKKRDINKITLKIQSDKWKRPLQIDIMKADKFRILYIKCAEELNVGIDQLKLSFDGEVLELNDTPANLDLEGGEAIDLRIKT